MGFISMFMMGAVVMFFVVSILLVFLIVKKIGMTLLAKKLNISNYGLLWIPGLGALYEGKIMNKYLNYGKKFEIGYFAIIMIIRVVWEIFFSFGPEYNDPSFSSISSIINDICGILLIIDVILKSITVKKSGYNGFISAIICIFLPTFWCYFVSAKTKKYS